MTSAAPLATLIIGEHSSIAAALTAVLISVLFDPALIVLSALMGSLMIADALALNDVLNLLVIAVLFVIGLVIQSRIGPAVRD